jgi:hypothetical protein
MEPYRTESHCLRADLPARRVVLLGASNLTRGIATVVETASRVWGRPLDVLAAFGHGRSFGLRRSVLGRELPGIIESGLWDALRRRSPAPTAALVTDIGNDLLYEVPVPEIAGWLERCLDRLQHAGARVVMTSLPLRGIENLSNAKFLILRTIFFPGCRLCLEAVRERAFELERRLRDLTTGRGVLLVAHRAEWYGFDPIHIKLRHWAAAWRDILRPWAEAEAAPEPAPRSLRRWIYLRWLAPEQRWFFGREQRKLQPAGRLADGTALSYY